MGILSRISNAKAKFRQVRTHKREIALDELEKKTKKIQEEAKVRQAHADALTKLAAAKETRWKAKTAGIRRAIGGLQKIKKQHKRKQGKSGGVFMQGSGIDFGGKKSEKKKSKKKKQIVINL